MRVPTQLVSSVITRSSVEPAPATFDLEIAAALRRETRSAGPAPATLIDQAGTRLGIVQARSRRQDPPGADVVVVALDRPSSTAELTVVIPAELITEGPNENTVVLNLDDVVLRAS